MPHRNSVLGWGLHALPVPMCLILVLQFVELNIKLPQITGDKKTSVWPMIFLKRKLEVADILLEINFQ